MASYQNVQFEFLSAADKPLAAQGSVVVRGDEMVLDVEHPYDANGEPYTIVGKNRGQYFEGNHQGAPDDVPVHAKWTLLDDVWIGTWVEDGIDYVFTFSLPEAKR